MNSEHCIVVSVVREVNEWTGGGLCIDVKWSALCIELKWGWFVYRRIEMGVVCL